MKNQYTLLHNCYFQFCQDSDPSVISSHYHRNESLAAPIKRERISLKRNSDSNPSLIKRVRSFNCKAEQEHTQTETQKRQNLNSYNMQTMSSTHRPDQERPQQTDRIIPTYFTQTQMVINYLPNVLNLLNKFRSQEKLDSHRQRKQKIMNGKMQNVKSQPLFVRKAQNFQEMAARISVAESQVQSPMTAFKQSQKKSSKYEIRQENGHKRTVTIQSIEGQTGGEQRIEQSMIEIDFFHPSTRRLLDLEKQEGQTPKRTKGSRMNNA